MTKLISQKKDEFVEMITWYNSQVFDWFNPNNKGGDSPASSGIDEVLDRMEDFNIYHSEIEPQDYDEPEGWNAAGTQVCKYNFFFSHMCLNNIFHFLIN
jgi:hypothetical protein